VLLTFDPHPLNVVRPEVAPPLLTLPDEKKEILAQLGLDYVAFVSFTLEFSRYSPENFVEDVVVPRFRPAEVVIGYDHGFGRGRAGDVSVLERLGGIHGFEVSVVEGVALERIAPAPRTRTDESGDLARTNRGRVHGLQAPLGLGARIEDVV